MPSGQPHPPPPPVDTPNPNPSTTPLPHIVKSRTSPPAPGLPYSVHTAPLYGMLLPHCTAPCPPYHHAQCTALTAHTSCRIDVSLDAKATGEAYMAITAKHPGLAALFVSVDADKGKALAYAGVPDAIVGKIKVRFAGQGCGAVAVQCVHGCGAVQAGLWVWVCGDGCFGGAGAGCSTAIVFVHAGHPDALFWKRVHGNSSSSRLCQAASYHRTRRGSAPAAVCSDAVQRTVAAALVTGAPARLVRA